MVSVTTRAIEFPDSGTRVIRSSLPLYSPISEAAGHLDEVAAESAATGEVIYLTRDGQRLAAIVPAAELEADQ